MEIYRPERDAGARRLMKSAAERQPFAGCMILCCRRRGGRPIGWVISNCKLQNDVPPVLQFAFVTLQFAMPDTFRISNHPAPDFIDESRKLTLQADRNGPRSLN
jgi:hypothetical protein